MSLRKAKESLFRQRLADLELSTYSHAPAFDADLAAASAPKVDHFDAIRLMDHEDEAVRMALLKNPSSRGTSAFEIWKKRDSYGPRADLLRLLAIHPRTSSFVLAKIIADDDAEAVRLARETESLLRPERFAGYMVKAAWILIPTALVVGGFGSFLAQIWLVRGANLLAALAPGLRLGSDLVLDTFPGHKTETPAWQFALLGLAGLTLIAFIIWPAPMVYVYKGIVYVALLLL